MGAAKVTLRESPPAARPAILSLLVIGADTFAVHPLPEAATLTIGRGRDSDIRIDEPSVSRQHARLHTGAALAIEDCGSANGTRVRDRRIEAGAPVPFAVDEVLRLGSVSVIVQPRACAEPRPRPVADRDGTPTPGAGVVIGDPRMRAVHRLVARMAGGDISILLLGETGVGKEIIAETIHARSPRAGRPFLRLNCAALSESLLESELFGHERGAFTGASQAKPGLLESAGGGTVFLDEIGELPPATQVKLLRVLEERRVMRVGALRSQPIDVRFVAATNRNLVDAVAAGQFRQDLYYRINGISITIPPLRERRAEIEPLAREFIHRFCRESGREPVPELSRAARRQLLRHPWPGNIRELRNAIERAVLLCAGRRIAPAHLPLAEAAPGEAPGPGGGPVAPAAERQLIIDALDQCAGNQTAAAQLLGMSRRTLVSRLVAYDIPRPRLRRAGMP